MTADTPDSPSAESPAPSEGEGSSESAEEGDVPALRSALLAWYGEHARELPWRGIEDPYRTWVSEMMLQQTRVSTVLGYWEPWFRRFPDLDALADAELDEVLLAWEGLGYYRRARFLHRGARMVRDELDGEIPSTYQGLREIPGLGEYAAGAVASIAFGRRVPAVDGNVRRVLSRWYDEPAPGTAWYRDRATELVDPERPGDWNQALMELGATVCTPSAPGCHRCPVAERCGARAAETQEERPAPSRKQKVAVKSFVSAVVVDESGRVLLRQRPADGLLGGMWSLPDAEVEVRDGGEDVVALARGVVAALGGAGEGAGAGDGDEADGRGVSMVPRDGLPLTLTPVRHRFSHIDATYRPVVLGGRALALDGEERPAEDSTLRWVDPADAGVALPVAQQAILKAVVSVLAGDGQERASEGEG